MPTHEKRTETEELEGRETQGKERSLKKGVSPAKQRSRSHGEPWLERPWDQPGGRAQGRSRLQGDEQVVRGGGQQTPSPRS